MQFSRILLAMSLVSAPLACTTDGADGPEYVEANQPMDTALGWFTLELEPVEGHAWPGLGGPTALAIHIGAGPDPLPEDPELNGAGKDIAPPFVLTLGDARPWDGPGGPTTVADMPQPVTPDGSEWMATFNFTNRGRWVVPVTITDFADRSDTVELVFRIE